MERRRVCEPEYPQNGARLVRFSYGRRHTLEEVLVVGNDTVGFAPRMWRSATLLLSEQSTVGGKYSTNWSPSNPSSN